MLSLFKYMGTMLVFVLGLGTVPGQHITNTDKTTTQNIATETVTNSGYKNGDEYVILKPVERYSDAESALAKKDSIGIYKPGSYFFFSKNKNGMINITSAKGTPGSWIDPSENYKPKTLNESSVGDSLALSFNYTKYASEEDARNMENPIGTSEVTVHKILEVSHGVYRVTKTDESEAFWINIADRSVDSPESPSKSFVPGERKLLSFTYKKFASAEDAAAQTDSIGYTSLGTYEVHSVKDGMVELSKDDGEKFWINPALKEIE